MIYDVMNPPPDSQTADPSQHPACRRVVGKSPRQAAISATCAFYRPHRMPCDFPVNVTLPDPCPKALFTYHMHVTPNQEHQECMIR